VTAGATRETAAKEGRATAARRGPLRGRELLAAELRANLPGAAGEELARQARAGGFHCQDGRATAALLDAAAGCRQQGRGRARGRATAGAYDEPPDRRAAVRRLRGTATPATDTNTPTSAPGERRPPTPPPGAGAR